MHPPIRTPKPDGEQEQKSNDPNDPKYRLKKQTESVDNALMQMGIEPSVTLTFDCLRYYRLLCLSLQKKYARTCLTSGDSKRNVGQAECPESRLSKRYATVILELLLLFDILQHHLYFSTGHITAEELKTASAKIFDEVGPPRVGSGRVWSDFFRPFWPFM
jgi:hypothetical protein